MCLFFFWVKMENYKINYPIITSPRVCISCIHLGLEVSTYLTCKCMLTEMVLDANTNRSQNQAYCFCFTCNTIGSLYTSTGACSGSYSLGIQSNEERRCCKLYLFTRTSGRPKCFSNRIKSFKIGYPQRSSDLSPVDGGNAHDAKR